MALTLLSAICYSFKTPPSCFAMNIKTSSKCLQEISTQFFWKSGHVQESAFRTSTTNAALPDCAVSILSFHFEDTFTTIRIFRIF